MSELLAPRPSNLTVPASRRYTAVEADLYNICERIKEIDPNLRVVMHEGRDEPWVVVERGPDGEERFVSRYAELDARVLEDLRYMLAVPFEKRLQVVEAKIKENNDQIGKMSDEQMERFSYEFQKALVESQISDPVWMKSYRNTKGKKGTA
jgi:hypothetical protein